MEVSVADLRRKTKEVLEAVDRDGSVTITIAETSRGGRARSERAEKEKALDHATTRPLVFWRIEKTCGM